MHPILISELAFNFILLGIDAAVVVAVASKRTAMASWTGLAAILCITAMVSVVIANETFLTMRLAAWGVFGHFPVVAIVTSWLARKTRWLAVSLFTVSALAVVVGIDAFVIEPRSLEITRRQISCAKLTDPLRIVVIADLQTDRFGDYERSALRSANEQKADLILMAGDYIQTRDTERWLQIRDEMRDFLRKINISARLGVYAVGGNSDWYRWTTIFEGLPVEFAASSATYTIASPEIAITCLSIDDSFDDQLHVEARPGFHIVLGHAPNFAMGQVDADLLIAGHTHGGQVRLPFIGPLITASLIPTNWAANLTEIAPGKHLLVSRGIGMERLAAPRLRFLCRPELAILDVVPPDNTAEPSK